MAHRRVERAAEAEAMEAGEVDEIDDTPGNNMDGDAPKDDSSTEQTVEPEGGPERGPEVGWQAGGQLLGGGPLPSKQPLGGIVPMLTPSATAHLRRLLPYPMYNLTWTRGARFGPSATLLFAAPLRPCM